MAVSLLAGSAGRRTRQAARATVEYELLAHAAASVVTGQQALAACWPSAVDRFHERPAQRGTAS